MCLEVPSHLSFHNWPQNIVRTLILSVVMSGAVGKPVGNRSNVRQSCHPRTFSPIVCGISHDSRDHAALCSALAHIHSVTVRGPRWPWPLGLIALPLPLPPFVHSRPGSCFGAFARLCLLSGPGPPHSPQVCSDAAFSVPGTELDGGRHPGSICWQQE